MTAGSLFWISYFALWAVVLLMAFALVILLQDVARQRLVSKEGSKRAVLPIGEVWHGITVRTVAEGRVHLPEPATNQLVVVGAKRCGLCREALFRLGQLAGELKAPVRCLYVYPGTPEEMHLNLGEPPSNVSVVYDVKNDMRRKLGIVTYPYAFAIDSLGRVQDARVAYERNGLDMLLGSLGVRTTG